MLIKSQNRVGAEGKHEQIRNSPKETHLLFWYANLSCKISLTKSWNIKLRTIQTLHLCRIKKFRELHKTFWIFSKREWFINKKTPIPSSGCSKNLLYRKKLVLEVLRQCAATVKHHRTFFFEIKEKSSEAPQC